MGIIIMLSVVFAIILVVACVVTYKTAEVHELHKVRAAFEDKRHILAKHYERLKEKNSAEGIEEKGEIEGIDDAIEIVNELVHLI